jgi:hypothetical protein
MRPRCCPCVFVCVSVHFPSSLLGDGSVKVPLSFLGNGYVFYAVRVVSKESRRLILLRTSSCSNCFIPNSIRKNNKLYQVLMPKIKVLKILLFYPEHSRATSKSSFQRFKLKFVRNVYCCSSLLWNLAVNPLERTVAEGMETTEPGYSVSSSSDIEMNKCYVTVTWTVCVLIVSFTCDILKCKPSSPILYRVSWHSGTTLDSYSSGARFESRSGGRLCWLRFVVVFLSLCTKMHG